ncbi:transcription initiation factor TFIID subunit 3 isoform X1 [Poecilia latipinna]|uniref:transcription initiation factor TFIID subunit 3 isoform X1 n=1 Tax=Poecilia latipinna TaxID=48699 RepID=UPI00072DEAA2|nr:PREDICTED: transcription initiation factor TFIID subunit 3 isoform X1 [Poecilia latipinna]
MCENYARSLLRVSVAQICQALGWDAVQLTACDLLSDVLHRYIQQLARVCHRYSELYGRTDPVLDDLSQAFRLMGVNLSELEDYVNNLEPVAFTHQTPLFPVNKNNVLQFPQPGVRDAEERKDYIPEYLPPLVSLQEAEEEEEEVPPDMGTSAEAMQVALEEDEDEIDEDEMVNDENHPLKRHLDSPDAALGMMPTSKRPRMYPGLSPEWGVEPREPLTSLNPQRVPPGILPSHDSLDPLSPETPSGPLPPFRPLPVLPKHSDQKALAVSVRKPKVSSPGRQRTKSPKGALPVAIAGSPIHSPKPSKERKKSPGRTKSPKSPKSPKMGSLKAPPAQIKAEALHKLSALSERMGKEIVHQRPVDDDPQFPEVSFKKLEPDNTAIDDSIDAVIARACAEREPDPFAFSSGSDSDSNGFSSPRRLTIMEPSTPKIPAGIGGFMKDTSTPLHPHAHVGLGNWTLDDSINEVVRKANQGGPSAPPPPLPPPIPAEYVSSGSASPPTPEPLLKVFEEKSKIAPPPLPPPDVKKKLKKDLKTKMKKKEKDKPKDKDREKDKSKVKEKNKEKNRDKNKEFSKELKMPWKDLKGDDLFMPREFSLPEVPIKIKSRDGEGTKKEREKHKDKKKDKEKSKKDKDKKEKNKDRNKEDKQKQSALSTFSLSDLPPLFSPSTCLRVPSMLPSLAPILHDKEVKSKEKEKKKDKKEKKKKKDKDKEREKAKEKEREKEEKRKEKEREKEKREKEKEKEKEKIRLEKVKMEAPAVLPSPVIPRLTLRVGAGQDKIVISKVVPNSEPKTPGTKTPATKSAPGNRPRTPPPPPVLPPVIPILPPASPLQPAPPPPVSLLPLPSMLPPSAASVKPPVRSVVTETVSTYVIRDEWGNQIWICPGCNKPDDGSPMIGCDDCDDWYHWPCVGILTPPPEDQPWFCVKCSSKKKDKKHKKKKHKPH